MKRQQILAEFLIMKTILITGAGRRLGRELALHYWQQGWRVLAHFNTVCELPDDVAIEKLQADLSDLAAIASMCQRLRHLGPVDAVIHNASCFQPDAAVVEDDWPDHVARHFNVHVQAPMMITRALDLQWQVAASMVVMSDIYAEIPNQRFGAYCASKAALQNWAVSMAQRLAGRVRVNVIQPGPVQFLPEHSPEYRQRVLSQSLIRQELGYGAIVKACDFLLDAEAMTGTVMRVDGGRFVANRYDQTFSV